jgi:predicted NACHT family NTPase
MIFCEPGERLTIELFLRRTLVRFGILFSNSSYIHNQITNMIGELAIRFALQESMKSTLKFLKEKKLKVDTTAKDVEEAISSHVTELNNWSKEISFNDLKKSKLTSQVFIDVDIFLMPKKSRVNIDEEIEKIPCKELFKIVDRHCVILGQPGAGKTTLMKYICQSILLEESFFHGELKIPIIIRLRDLNTKGTERIEKGILINYLFDLLGLVVSKEKADVVVESEDYLWVKERILLPLIDSLKLMVILDGFDELASPKLKERVFEDFKKLVLNLTTSKVLLTSLTSDYNYNVETTSVLEICPLSLDQIRRFAIKWLVEESKVEQFLVSLHDSPFVDTAIRPLTLSHLCAIFERIGKIPDKPKTVYKKVVGLLLEEWDEQRAVTRVSQYGNFEVDRKFEFLSRMAFEITVQFNRTLFNERELRSIYNEISPDFGLNRGDINKVIKEVEGHTGLIVQSGYHDYEFAHKSIHEYLSAEYLVKLPSIPTSSKILSLMPNELAIATTISSNSSLYFTELVLNRFYRNNYDRRSDYFGNKFFTTFVNRFVLEKPDFNLSSDISFSLVVLYTLFRRGESGQLSLFNFELPIQFERFVQHVFKRNKKFEFAPYYDVEESFESETDEKIIKLKLKPDVNKQIGNSPLPRFLYAKKSFVEI